MLHYMSVTDMREEDLVVLLYFLLASDYGSLHEFAAYGPEIVVRRRLVGVDCDKEITAERSKQFPSFVKTFYAVGLGGGNTPSPFLNQSLTHPR